MKAGFKRLWILMMVSAVPLVSAQPVSSLQEAPDSSFLTRMEIAKEQGVLLPSSTFQKTTQSSRSSARIPRPVLFGTASWYSATDPGINRHTANGEIFNDRKMTCASWNFPFGTRLRITNLGNGRSVVCVVNDRGPAKRLGRMVDLTKAAFRRIADPRLGLARVSVTPIRD